MKLIIVLLGILWATFANAQMTTQQRQEFIDVNALSNANPGFENGSVKWTNAGSGTYTTTTTAANVAFGVRAASWDAAAASDTLTSTAVTVPPGMYGANCEADLTYKGGDANVAVKVIDGSSTVLITRTLATSTNFTTIRLPFTCPTSSTFKVQFAATANAAVMYIDQVFLGLARFNPDVSPVVYTVSKSAVGAVGTTTQIVLGHTLTSDDFPTTGSSVMWYPMTSASDGSGNAVNFTATGSPVFTATGINGVASSGMTLNGSSQYLKSTSASLQPAAAQHYYAGGWFKPTNWATAGKVLFQSIASLSDRGFSVLTSSATALQVNATNAAAASSWSTGDIYASGTLSAGWHHVAIYYDATDLQFRIYIDGRRVSSTSLSDLRPTANFKIGVDYNESSGYLTGDVDEFAVLKNVRLTDDDIRKIAAFKTSHNKGVPVADQQWVGQYARSDNKIVNQMMPDWIVAQDDNSVWWDLSGLTSTSQFSAKLMQNGFTSTIVPAQTYMTSELSSAPSTPITHGLPGRPAWVLVEQEGQVESTSWSPLDGVCWSKGDTQLNCDFTGLTIDSTHKIRITASMIPGGSAVRLATAAGTSGLYTPGATAGYTSGVAPCAGCVGELLEANAGAAIPSTSATANTWVDASATGTISLTAGYWQIGYSVALDSLNNTAVAGMLGGCNVALWDSTTSTFVPNSVSLSWLYGPASSNVTQQTSMTVFLNTTISRTISLRLRSSTVNTNCRILGTSNTGGLTDPDENSRIWALRLH